LKEKDMNAKVIDLAPTVEKQDWVEIARSLAPEFGMRAVDYDESGDFVTENYRHLREHKLFFAGIPEELGGGGASYEALCDIVREIGQHCGSTALSFSMHTHPVLANVFKYRRGDKAAAGTLRSIAANELVIANTGANDWLESSGTAERIAGGYRVSARKHFVSGGPGADVFITSTTYTGENGREVLHFAIPFASKGVEILDTWRTHGMRGTGSHDVVLSNTFVPEEAIVARRRAGEWHAMWDAVIPTALPLITAAYVGLAESAAKLATDVARRNAGDLASVVGEMLNELTIAQMTLADMIRMNNNHGFTPSLEFTSEILARKAIAARAIKNVVEIGAELVGGPGFFRGHAMERIVRDVRAMNFHPLPIRRQQVFSGRLALGLDPVKAA
jgi:alkylation response protein AidB-like acyl-CoA dehydrogenase